MAYELTPVAQQALRAQATRIVEREMHVRPSDVAPEMLSGPDGSFVHVVIRLAQPPTRQQAALLRQEIAAACAQALPWLRRALPVVTFV